jgi:hypothetical protein
MNDEKNNFQDFDNNLGFEIIENSKKNTQKTNKNKIKELVVNLIEVLFLFI